MHPELSCEEKRTSGLVANRLRKLGIEVYENIGGYGVVGILKGGIKGKVIGWRAEMDAIVVNLESRNSFNINKKCKELID